MNSNLYPRYGIPRWLFSYKLTVELRESLHGFWLSVYTEGSVRVQLEGKYSILRPISLRTVPCKWIKIKVRKNTANIPLKGLSHCSLHYHKITTSSAPNFRIFAYQEFCHVTTFVWLLLMFLIISNFHGSIRLHGIIPKPNRSLLCVTISLIPSGLKVFLHFSEASSINQFSLKYLKTRELSLSLFYNNYFK